MWTVQHLADDMAQQTAIRVTYEMVRLLLKRAEFVMSRLNHKISSPGEEYEVKKWRLKRPVTQ